MKIALASDLHLEFGPISLDNEGADVLILSGDILVAHRLGDRDVYNIMGEAAHSNRYHEFMQECSARFPHVVYIAGNHEHYDGDFAVTLPKLKEKFSYLKNVHILDKECITIDDVTFIGGTLWTDMNKEDPMTLHAIGRMMNDFRIVDNSNRKVTYKTFDENNKPTFRERIARFSPEDAVEDHKKMIQYLQTVIEGKNEKFVVVGHHAPSKQSTHPRYKDETLMNGGYSSDLSEYILDHPQIKLWTHGHTHEDFDYMIGSTRIVCNPRGYINYEDRADQFKLKYIDV
jgi:Icc-related predicted phosphoesterase